MPLVLRIGLIITGLIIVLIAGVLILVFNSSFQTALARKVLKDQAEEVRLEKLDLGLNGINVQDFYFKNDQGLVVKLKEADIHIDLLDAAFDEEIHISLFRAAELEIDISGLQPPDPTDEGKKVTEVKETEKESIPSEIKIPLIWLDEVDIDNAVFILSEDRRVHLNVSGGKIEPQKTGVLKFLIHFSDQAEEAEIAQLKLNGHIELGQPSKGTLDLGLILMGSSEESKDEMLNFKAQLNQAQNTITGGCTLGLDKTKVAEFFKGTELPEFTVNSSIQYSFSMPTQAGELKGVFDVKMTELADLKPELQALEVLDLHSEFDLAFEGQSLSLKTLKTEVKDAQNKSILNLENLKTVSFDLAASESSLEKISGDLVKLKIQNLPVDWFAPFAPDLDISGDTISADFTLSQEKNSIGLTFNEPLSIKKVSLAQKGKPLLNEIDFIFQPQVDFDLERQSARIKLEKLNLASERSTIADVGAQLDLILPKNEDPITLKATKIDVTVDLPQLFRQPVLATQVSEIASGKLTLQGDLTWGKTPTADCVINLNELKSTADLKSEIHSLNVKIKAEQEKDGTLLVEVPTKLIGSEGTSDIDLNLRYKMNEKEDDTFDLKAKSKQMVVVDFQSLAQAFSPAPTDTDSDPFGTPQTEVPQTLSATPFDSEAPEKAFWAGYQGQVQTEFDKVLLPDGQVLQDLRTELKVESNRVEIETLRANLDPSRFKMTGVVAFDQGQATPYDLKSKFELKDFDIGAFFKKVNPGQAPTMEAIIHLSGDVTGQWLNPDDLSQTAQGKLLFTSKNGLIRPFEQGAASENSTVQQGSQLVKEFQKIGELFGTQLEGVKEVGEVQDIFSYFEEIPFSECVVKINRAEDLDFKIEEFLIKNPELYLKGKGTITYQENVPITDLPLHINIQLAAKNKAAEILDDINLLTSDKDNEDFILGPRYAIKGTVGAPDYSTFYSILETAVKNSITDKTLGSASGSLSEASKKEEEGEKEEGGIQSIITDVLKEAATQGLREIIAPDD